MSTLYRATNLLNDPRLYGEALISPLRACMKSFSHATHTSKIKEIAADIPGIVALLPAFVLAGIGAAVKWVDLGRRIDQFAHKGPAITYALPLTFEPSSRLGDRLTAYLHTKYVAEKYGIPLYFRPFKGIEGADFFSLSETEQLVESPTEPVHFKRTVYLSSSEAIEALSKADPNESVLYVLPCAPDSSVDVDWNAFKPRVKELLTIVKPHELIPLDEQAYKIALHVRTGGTYDSPDTATLLPTKLPPLSYYIGELEELLRSEHIPKDQPIFVHIFTDDVNPEKVAKRIQEGLSSSRKVTVSFAAQPSLINDVANMPRFNCIIRPTSNLSSNLAMTAESLDLEVFPSHFKVNQQWTEIIVDKVERVYANGVKESKSTHYPMPVVARYPKCFYRLFHRYVLGVK